MLTCYSNDYATIILPSNHEFVFTHTKSKCICAAMYLYGWSIRCIHNWMVGCRRYRIKPAWRPLQYWSAGAFPLLETIVIPFSSDSDGRTNTACSTEASIHNNTGRFLATI